MEKCEESSSQIHMFCRIQCPYVGFHCDHQFETSHTSNTSLACSKSDRLLSEEESISQFSQENGEQFHNHFNENINNKM